MLGFFHLLCNLTSYTYKGGLVGGGGIGFDI